MCFPLRGRPDAKFKPGKYPLTSVEHDKKRLDQYLWKCNVTTHAPSSVRYSSGQMARCGHLDYYYSVLALKRALREHFRTQHGAKRRALAKSTLLEIVMFPGPRNRIPKSRCGSGRAVLVRCLSLASWATGVLRQCTRRINVFNLHGLIHRTVVELNGGDQSCG